MLCPHCKKKMVALYRVSPYQKGWGCLTCKTAKKIKVQCTVCKKELDIVVAQDVELNNYTCDLCLASQTSYNLFGKNIPSWRLNLDDASELEILTKPLSEFGTPYMDQNKWKEFYSQPHEIKKNQEFQATQRKMMREGIRELVQSREM